MAADSISCCWCIEQELRNLFSILQSLFKFSRILYELVCFGDLKKSNEHELAVRTNNENSSRSRLELKDWSIVVKEHLSWKTGDQLWSSVWTGGMVVRVKPSDLMKGFTLPPFSQANSYLWNCLILANEKRACNGSVYGHHQMISFKWSHSTRPQRDEQIIYLFLPHDSYPWCSTFWTFYLSLPSVPPLRFFPPPPLPSSPTEIWLLYSLLLWLAIFKKNLNQRMKKKFYLQREINT